MSAPQVGLLLGYVLAFRYLLPGGNMTNHQRDLSLGARRQLQLTKLEFPDGYWTVDFTVHDPEMHLKTCCVPLLSGNRLISQAQRGYIKSTLSFALDYVLDVDFEVDPF
jgi:hypothetical protein